jgi:RNA polymerase sigma factor (sigma-70 family)
MVPKWQKGQGRGLSQQAVDQIYTDYLRLRSMRETAKLHGRTRQAVWEIIARRKLQTYQRVNRDVIEYNGAKFTPGKGGYFRATRGDRRPLHHAMWIDANGPIPPGYQVSFKDGDKRNCTLENLWCAPTAEVSRKNATGLNQHTKARLEKRIQDNMGFLYMKAKPLAEIYKVPVDELVDAGKLGIMKADRKFVAKRGVKFLTYAAWWIKSEMQKYLAQQGSAVVVPQNKYFEAQNFKRSQVNLNAPIDAEDDRTYADVMLSIDEESTDNTERTELLEGITKALAQLKPADQQIVRDYFFENKTMDEIAVQNGVTHQAIQQRMVKIKRKLRFKLREFQEAA